MTTIYVPYHLDERLDGLVDEPADVTVTAELPEDTDVWVGWQCSMSGSPTRSAGPKRPS